MATEAIDSRPPPIYHSSNAELLNKRKADEPNNTELSDPDLDPPPKRILVLDEEEFKLKDSDSDSDSESGSDILDLEKMELDSDYCYPPEWVDYEGSPKQVPPDYQTLKWPEYPDWVYCTKKPHEQRDLTTLEYFFNREKFMNVFAHKVMEITQLKHLTDDLMLSLVKHDHHDVFAGKVNDLVNCPDFIQACSDTYYADNGFNDCVYFFNTIEDYKDGKSPEERMKNLRNDPLFQHVLEQTEPLSITRGVLSALLGFWSDDAFCNKLTAAIYANRRK